MCYMVFISTTADRDLSERNAPPFVIFERDLAHCEPGIADLLKYPRKWHVGVRSACSCTFRHLSVADIGFGVPEDWYPEEAEEIEATKQFYDVVASLVSAGQRVDCISHWAGTPKNAVKHLDVDLASVSREAFRFFENYHFTFSHSGKRT